jgi:hypothetical protein
MFDLTYIDYGTHSKANRRMDAALQPRRSSRAEQSIGYAVDQN